MGKLILNHTSTEQWQALIKETELACQEDLSEDFESDLVFLLMRFVTQPEIAKSVMALDFLKGQH